tara:strand:+ start:232 stop:432 length:201 start_codon:yes stop_codon:yes gene_type:complete
MRNEYADRLGYARELDLLFDFYDEDDLKNMIELFLYHAESEELLDLINELVGELVENNANLQDVVY